MNDSNQMIIVFLFGMTSMAVGFWLRMIMEDD